MTLETIQQSADSALADARQDDPNVRSEAITRFMVAWFVSCSGTPLRKKSLRRQVRVELVELRRRVHLCHRW